MTPIDAPLTGLELTYSVGALLMVLAVALIVERLCAPLMTPAERPVQTSQCARCRGWFRREALVWQRFRLPNGSWSEGFACVEGSCDRALRVVHGKFPSRAPVVPAK